MSLPPQVIQVKRKRTEEGPVPSFLRIEHATKRHRSDAFLYRRHDPEAAASAAAAAAAAANDAAARANRPPTILVSQPGAEKRKPAGEAAAREATAGSTAAAAGALPLPEPPQRPPASAPAAEPRRFHLSRDTLLMAAHRHNAARKLQQLHQGLQRTGNYPGARGGAGSAGGLADTAVFVERGSRHRSSSKKRRPRQREGGGGSGATELRKKASIAALRAGAGAAAPLPKRSSGRSGRSTPKPAEPSTAAAAAAAAAETSVGATDATAGGQPAPALPGSVANRRWDTNMDQLTRDMNAYTLEILGRNLAQMEQQKPQAAAASAGDGAMSRWEAERRKAAYAKYKPKPVVQAAEKQRLTAASAAATAMTTAGKGLEAGRAGRAGGSATATDDDSGGDNNDDDASETDSDDDDYVTETYVRIPGHEAPPQAQAGATGAAAGTVGLLVFDHEPDLEFFYGVEEDSEEEFDDDEDENAENYYTHDYPEDEVSSDDEFDRDPYHYLTGNASDEEEYVLSDADEGR